MQNRNSKAHIVSLQWRAQDQEESESSCIKNQNSQLQIISIDQVKYRRDSIQHLFYKKNKSFLIESIFIRNAQPPEEWGRGDLLRGAVKQIAT